MPVRPFTDEEWETLPHVELTKNSTNDNDLWDPSVLDHEHDLDGDEWYDAVQCDVNTDATRSFDSQGSLNWRFCLQLRARRNRRSGNSHDLLREFVNSIMNNMFMTGLGLVRKILDTNPEGV